LPTNDPIAILLAEDNPADQRLVAEALTIHELSHTLHIVEDGEEALRTVKIVGYTGQVRCPDLLILDLHLPRIDGLEVLREFRANENCANVPVLVFTSSISPAERSEAERLSGVQFVHKPTELDDFLAVGGLIKSLVGRAHSN
jgi:CheY-like chemotaxis protein